MSYSFSVRAASKAEAKTLVKEKFLQACASQACHERDKVQALAVADSFIDLLTDDDSKDVGVSMNGSLTGQWTGFDVTRIEGSSVSVNAYLATRLPTAT